MEPDSKPLGPSYRTSWFGTHHSSRELTIRDDTARKRAIQAGMGKKKGSSACKTLREAIQDMKFTHRWHCLQQGWKSVHFVQRCLNVSCATKVSSAGAPKSNIKTEPSRSPHGIGPPSWLHTHPVPDNVSSTYHPRTGKLVVIARETQCMNALSSLFQRGR